MRRWVGDRLAGVLEDVRDWLDAARGQAPRPRAFSPNAFTIEEAERAIRHEAVEWAYVFDRQGVQVVRRRGGARGVSFTTNELDALVGARVLHNHPIDDETPPESLTFSTVDLTFAVRYNLAELRAVAGD